MNKKLLSMGANAELALQLGPDMAQNALSD